MNKIKLPKNKKLTALLIIIAIIFILLMVSILIQYNKNAGADFALLQSNIKYLIFAIVAIIPLFLLILLATSFKKSENNDLVTPDYFNVDFDRIDKEKKKLKKYYVKKKRGVVTVEVAPTNKPKVPYSKDEEEVSEEQTEQSRFYMLTEIDKVYENFEHPEYNNEISLKEFCEEFRNYSANKLKLYYDIEDIRRFIGALAVTKLIILQGMSGTGKTSLAYAFGEFLDNKTVVVPIQPMWKERTDLIGYYNEFTKKFNETTLLYKMYEANYSKDIYITVLDEMNIARVEYYFAEFLSLLEIPDANERYLDVVSDTWETDPVKLVKGQIKLPINMWFIGTANNDDSTFAISDKVYDRAMVLNLDSKTKPFIAPRTKTMHLSQEYYEKKVKEALSEYEITNRNQRRIKELDEYLIKHFHITFGNRIMKHINTYVPVFVACGGDEVEAIDDILSKKVLRKLEAQNPVYIKNSAEGFCTYLDELFGQDKMKFCKEYMRRLQRNI